MTMLKKILIAEHDPELSHKLSDLLNGLGLEPLIAEPVGSEFSYDLCNILRNIGATPSVEPCQYETALHLTDQFKPDGAIIDYNILAGPNNVLLNALREGDHELQGQNLQHFLNYSRGARNLLKEKYGVEGYSTDTTTFSAFIDKEGLEFLRLHPGYHVAERMDLDTPVILTANSVEECIGGLMASVYLGQFGNTITHKGFDRIRRLGELCDFALGAGKLNDSVLPTVLTPTLVIGNKYTTVTQRMIVQNLLWQV